MRPAQELAQAARAGLGRVEAATDGEEAEVFVSQNGSLELLLPVSGDRGALAGLGLILGGDVTMLQVRMANP